MQLPLAWLIEPEQLLFLALIALLLFGKRLPEVGRSLGKGIIEFKKGLAGIEEDVTKSGQELPATSSANRTALPPAYKFDPYTGKPLSEPAAPQMRFDPYTGKALNEPSSSQASGSKS